jgi:hypothetical protein
MAAIETQPYIAKKSKDKNGSGKNMFRNYIKWPPKRKEHCIAKWDGSPCVGERGLFRINAPGFVIAKWPVVQSGNIVARGNREGILAESRFQNKH